MNRRVQSILLNPTIGVAALAWVILAPPGMAQTAPGTPPPADDQLKITLQISGDIGVGFGRSTYDKGTSQSIIGPVVASGTPANYDAYSEWVTSYEARFRFTYGNDQAGAVAMLRPRGNQSGIVTEQNSNGTGSQGLGNAMPGTGSLSDLYGEVYWNPTPRLNITAGRLIGPQAFQPLAGSYLIANPVYNGPELWMSWTGANGVVATYDGGTWQAGVGLASQCIPSCGSFAVVGSPLNSTSSLGAAGFVPYGGAVQSAIGYSLFNIISPSNLAQTRGLNGNVVAPLAANQDTQTVDPFVSARMGAVSLRAHAPMTQGTLDQKGSPDGVRSSTSKLVSGQGYALGASWNGLMGWVLAADFQTFTDNKKPGAYEAFYSRNATVGGPCPSGPGSCQAIRDNLRDITRTAIVLKASYFGFEVDYMDLTVDNGRSDCTTYTNVFSEGVPDTTGSTGSSCKFDNQWFRFAYAFPAGPVTIVPEYSQVTLGKQGQQKTQNDNVYVLPGDLTNTLVRVVMRVVF